MDDKLHFDDLTKITCPIGMLDDDTRRRLTEHSMAYDIQGWGADGWVTIRKPLLYSGTVYRAAPFTMPVYPWAALHERILWCAVDDKGDAWAYMGKPTQQVGYWRSGAGMRRIDGAFAGYKPGTVDWRDSLQERPEK